VPGADERHGIIISYDLPYEETFMRRGTILITLAAITLATSMLFTQCSKDRYAVSSRNMAPEREAYDIEMSMAYLTEEDLLEKFTTSNNPYVPPKTLVSATDMIVFEVSVINNTPGKTILVPYESIRMVAGNTAFVPISSHRLSEFWSDFLNRSGTRDTRDYKSTGGKMTYVINETLFANPARVQGGGTYSGIVAFMGRFRKYGWGELNVPVFDEQERVIGIFAEEFERY
jgi:hypothetical protein